MGSEPFDSARPGASFLPDVILWLGLFVGVFLMGGLAEKLELEPPEPPAVDGSTAEAIEELLELLLDEGGGVRWQAWASSLLLIPLLVLLWLTISRGVRPRPPPPSLFLWRDLISIVLAWIFFLQAGLVVVALTSGGLDSPLSTFQVMLCPGVGTLVLVAVLGRLRGALRGVDGRIRAILGAPGSLWNLGAGLLAYVLSAPVLLALLVAVTVLAHRAGLDNPAQGVGLLVAEALGSGGWGIAVVVLFVCVTAPLSEELFFRGILQRRLRNAEITMSDRSLIIQPWAAALGSALLFTLLHTEGSGLSPYQLIIFALGLLLAILYERTGDVRVTFAVHAAHNTANLVLLLAEQA